MTLALPEGWGMVEDFFARTAAGLSASPPSATFRGPQGQILVLNPLQWVAQNGSCHDSAIGPLCTAGPEDAALAAAIRQMLPSPGLAGRPDFGGARFRVEGEDPMCRRVPGWRAE